MIDPATLAQLRAVIFDCINTDRGVLDALREEIRPLKNTVRRIMPRATTSISLVGTDGGNNQLQFDPFFIQLIRVVDSSNNAYCIDAISPTTPIDEINARQFDQGQPCTALGHMICFLGVEHLSQLSLQIAQSTSGVSHGFRWVEDYRELVEWAVLFALLEKDFGTDTLIVYDGLLRSRVFAKYFFQKLLRGMKTRIDAQWSRNRRRIYLTGVAKSSKVLSRYRLAMALEGVLQTDYPAYVEVPKLLEERAYLRLESVRSNAAENTSTVSRFTGGTMYLVKFGNRPRDPVWPVDIFQSQKDKVQETLGALLADALNGFPVPYYPQCLQKAHESAALVGFDFDILQDSVLAGMREGLGIDARLLDAFLLQEADPAKRRYG